MAELLRLFKVSNGVVQEYTRTIDIIFKMPYAALTLNLDNVAETKIIKSKPFDVPILIVIYKGYNNCDYFSFFHLEAAQKLKQAIDEGRESIFLEEI